MANLHHIPIFFAHVVFLLPCSRAAVIAQPCTQPPPLDNGFLYPVEQQLGRQSVMNYMCNEGFKPITGGWWSTITCEQGQWQPAPLCIGSQNSCSAPPKRPNAVIKTHYKGIFNDKDRVQYQCMDEYKMNGPSYSDCDQGKWTEVGECVPDTQDGRRGHNEERNAGDGDASGSQGVAGGQQCPDPPSIQHGDIVAVSSDKKTVTYQCANYYKINGTAKMTCKNGHWSPPSCEANYCKVEGKVENLMPLASAKFINGGGEETFYCEDIFFWRRTAVGTCERGHVNFRGCGSYYTLEWTIPSAV